MDKVKTDNPSIDSHSALPETSFPVYRENRTQYSSSASQGTLVVVGAEGNSRMHHTRNP